MNFIISHMNVKDTHGFGRIPDAPEPTEIECMEDCFRCKWAEVLKDGSIRCNDVNGEGFIDKEEA